MLIMLMREEPKADNHTQYALEFKLPLDLTRLLVNARASRLDCEQVEWRVARLTRARVQFSLADLLERLLQALRNLHLLRLG